MAAPPAPAVDPLAVMLGYWYASSAVVDGPSDAPSLERLGHTGLALDGRRMRAPHRWLGHEGNRRSTLDLFEGQLSLLSAADGVGWLDALQIAASARRLPPVKRRSTRRRRRAC